MVIKEAKKEYFRVDLFDTQNLVPMSIDEWENEVINHINHFTIDRYCLAGVYTKRFLLNNVTWYIEKTYTL